MIVHCSLQSWMSGSNPPYTFLPLALAALTTAVIFGVQRFAELFPDHHQSFKKHQSISKGANQ